MNNHLEPISEPTFARTRLVPIAFATLLAAAAFGPLHAQQSANFKVREFVLNEGGHPDQGSVLASTSYRVRLDSIGDGLTARVMSSASYRSEAGFVSGYPPPGEPQGVRYTDRTTLTWSPDRSVGTYNVYRELVETLPGLGFGACFAHGLSGATIAEPADPPDGAGWFYLVTARNRLGEEGSKGRRSDGALRGNPAPCP